MADRNLTTGFRRPRLFTNEGMELIFPPSAVKEVDSIPAKIDPFLTNSATQEFPLGTKLVYGDRVFRYVLAGGTSLVAGSLYQSVVPLAGHIDEAIDAPAVGTSVISFTPAATTTDDLTANELSDGYLWVNDETGEGRVYRIKSHPAITGAVAGNITLFDPIQIAPAAAATASVVHNPWRSIIVVPASTGPTSSLVGVAIHAVTNAQYGWIQTEGPCAVLTDGTVVIGCQVMPSDGSVAGAVEAWVPETDTTSEVESMGPIGWVLAVNATTEHSLIWLRGLP